MLVCPAVFKTVCGRLKTCRMSSILIHPRQKRERGGSAEPPRSCSFCYALADFTVRYTRRQTALRAELLALYRAADLRPERTDRVLARFDAKDRAEAERVLESLLTGGELIALAPRLCLHREVYVCACALVRAYFADHEALTLAAFRDLLGTSRDSALLVLECLDRNGRTRREGDLRRPGRRLYE